MFRLHIKVVNQSKQPIPMAVCFFIDGEFSFEDIAGITNEIGECSLPVEKQGWYMLKIIVEENEVLHKIQMTRPVEFLDIIIPSSSK